MSKRTNRTQVDIPVRERRRSRRRPILETFSMFCVVPKKGVYRLPGARRESDQGIGFDLDTEGEELHGFSLKLGVSRSRVHFYLNQSLFPAVGGQDRPDRGTQG